MIGLRFVWQVLLLNIILSSLVNAQNSDCNVKTNVELGKVYTLNSPNYPNIYSRNKKCRWIFTCPANTQCKLTCSDVDIPETSRCSEEGLLVSNTGDSTLKGANRYCGKGTLETISSANQLSVGLISSWKTKTRGKFSCQVVAMLDSTLAAATSCDCGWKYRTRIVNGVETAINEYPFMVGLFNYSSGDIFCGGAIVSPTHVITAAHCVYGVNVSAVGIVYGEHNFLINNETDITRIVPALSIINHPDYNTLAADSDIAIVVGTESIAYSDRIGPACLPFNYASESFVDQYIEVLGWGNIVEGGPDSPFLRKVSLKVTSQDFCRSWYGQGISEKILCTYEEGKDSCQGDSGGPLIWMNPSNGRLYLVAVVSGGRGCATSYPGLNTRVTQFLPWITENTAGETFCTN